MVAKKNKKKKRDRKPWKQMYEQLESSLTAVKLILANETMNDTDKVSIARKMIG